jgi:phage shock protein A
VEIQKMANSILTRLARFFKASAHDALDNIEDPGANARQMVRELSQNIAKTEEACASVIGDQKLIERKRDAASVESQQWNEKAAQAVQAERDDLARSALQRAEKAERNLAAYDKALTTLTPRVEELKSKLAELRDQRDEAENEVELLDARAKAAKASSTASRILGGVGASPVDFDNVRNRVNKLEADSEALAEVAADKSSLGLDDEFAALGKSSVDDKLAALKSGVNAQGKGV